MNTWDAILVGGGIIGLSMSIALRKRGLKVLIVERGEPGREASYAAAGMLADHGAEMPAALLPLAIASARMYPEFVRELQDESGMKIDLRDEGTLFFPAPGHTENTPTLSFQALAELEPSLDAHERPAIFLKERSVDPRALTAAALQAAKHREVDIVSSSPVLEILLAHERAAGVQTERSRYHAPIVVNCAGAWAGQFSPQVIPARPVKGQIFTMIGGPKLRHVIRAEEVYLVPRNDGRIVIGATMEEAGYDKRTLPGAIQALRQAAMRFVPSLNEARIHEDWAGLRPGTPDNLPILGETKTPGYFVATGHFRDGILLTPVTAHLMAQLITGEPLTHDLTAFSLNRFSPVASTI